MAQPQRRKVSCRKLPFRSVSYKCRPIANASLVLRQLHSHVSAHLDVFVRPPASRLRFDIPLVMAFPFIRSSASGRMQLLYARKPICFFEQGYKILPTFTRACGLSMHLDHCGRLISCPRLTEGYTPGAPYRGVWFTVKSEG